MSKRKSEECPRCGATVFFKEDQNEKACGICGGKVVYHKHKLLYKISQWQLCAKLFVLGVAMMAIGTILGNASGNPGLFLFVVVIVGAILMVVAGGWYLIKNDIHGIY